MDEEIRELIKLQQMPKIHIGIEEKVPTTRYGNKTVSLNVSFYHDVDKEKIKEVAKMLETIKKELLEGIETDNLKGTIKVGDKIIGSVTNE